MLKKMLFLSLAALLAAASTVVAEDTLRVSVTWYGHACFLVTTSDGTEILLDPIKMDEYVVPAKVTPDIVTVSHNHFDHNQVETVLGEPIVVYGKEREGDDHLQQIILVDTTVHGVRMYTVASNHFPPEESPSLNALFVFEFDGLRLAHLGDLGTTLNAEQIVAIGEIDILMIPVGGKYTIWGAKADSVVAQLGSPRLVFPMHYRTRVADFLPHTADDFIAGKTNIRRYEGQTHTFDPAALPSETKYVLFDFFKGE